MSENLTLYTITDDTVLSATNRALSGEPITRETLVEALDIVLQKSGLPEAASSAGAVMLNLDSQIESLITAENRLQGRRAFLESLRETAESWTLRAMQEQEVRIIEDQSGAFTITRKKNPPKVEILNEKEIPQTFRIIEIVEKIDRRGICATLKKLGGDVPGARLTQTERLEVR